MCFMFITVVLIVAGTVAARPSENDRVELWRKEGNKWPPQWQPETKRKKEMSAIREQHILDIPHRDERWENYLQFTQSRLVPRFTEKGFDLVDTPPHIHEKLRAAVDAGIKDFDNLQSEGNIDVIFNERHKEPKMVRIGSLANEVLLDMTEMHENWGGMKLKGTSAYGVRLYQNESTLVMHYDRISTHVISSIIHIAHEYDNDDEPWPIQIEDHDGNLHSISLKAGQMLFYESSVCLHGRMTKLKGKYYGSIFLHYKPLDTSIWNYVHDDVIAHVPPHWSRGAVEGRGSRYSGAALSHNNVITEQTPDRVDKDNQVTDVTPTIVDVDALMARPVHLTTEYIQKEQQLVIDEDEDEDGEDYDSANDEL